MLVTACINVVVNAAIAWVSVMHQRTVPLWSIPRLGHTNTATDTVGTFFFLPLSTCVFCSISVRIALHRKHIGPVPLGEVGSVLGRLPAGLVRRGATLGGLFVVALSPIALLVLVAVGFDDVTKSEFVVYKAVLGVILGLIVTPVIALRAMADVVPVAVLQAGRSTVNSNE